MTLLNSLFLTKLINSKIASATPLFLLTTIPLTRELEYFTALIPIHVSFRWIEEHRISAWPLISFQGKWWKSITKNQEEASFKKLFLTGKNMLEIDKYSQSYYLPELLDKKLFQRVLWSRFNLGFLQLQLINQLKKALHIVLVCWLEYRTEAYCDN